MDLPGSSVGPGNGLIQDRLGGPPDVRTGSISFNKGDDGKVRHQEFPLRGVLDDPFLFCHGSSFNYLFFLYSRISQKSKTFSLYKKLHFPYAHVTGKHVLIILRPEACEVGGVTSPTKRPNPGLSRGSH